MHTALRGLQPAMPSFPGGVHELGFDASGRYRHDDGLDRTDLRIRDAAFLSIAKAMGHSRVASHRHRGGQVEQAGGFRIQQFVLPSGCGKGFVGLVLFCG